MSRIEELADHYTAHIATPWQRTVAGAQRVIILVYDKELERTLQARKELFEIATTRAKHDWHEIDVSNAFSDWMAKDEYRDAYFNSPDDMQMKLEAEFPAYVAEKMREPLQSSTVTEKSVVAVFGLGALFGFTRVSDVLKLVEADIRGRLLLFFPGQIEGNNYRLLDARDGWNYLAVPISQHGEGAWV